MNQPTLFISTIPVILRTNQVPLSGHEASITYKRIHPTQMIRHLTCAFNRVQVGLVCLISVRPYCSNTQSEPSVALYKTNCLGLASPSSSSSIVSQKVNKVEERMRNRHFKFSAYASVCWSCHSKYQRLVDSNYRDLMHMVLEAGSSRSMCQQIRFLLRPPSLCLADGRPFSCPHWSFLCVYTAQCFSLF